MSMLRFALESTERLARDSAGEEVQVFDVGRFVADEVCLDHVLRAESGAQGFASVRVALQKANVPKASLHKARFCATSTSADL